MSSGRPHPTHGSASRAKLPAYAKSLLEARRAGQHPAVVVVIYGQDWSAPDVWARVAVKPGAALGLDWRCAAGVGVQVIDRSTAAEDDYDAEGNRELFFMLGEIAQHAACVVVETPEPLFAHQRRHGVAAAHVLAWCARRWDPVTHASIWPAWWSEEIEKKNADQRRQWFVDVERHLDGYAARVAA